MDETSARLAIGEVLARLAFTQDTRDWSSFQRLFADSVRLDLSTMFGAPPLEIAAVELASLASATLDGFDCTHHSAANLLVEFTEDEARCSAHITSYHHVVAPPGVIDFCTVRGYWHLSLRQEQERWVITAWAVVRTAPWEGSPDVYRLAAEGRARTIGS